jgi:4,5-dihydroxyphthalate decarboxylase
MSPSLSIAINAYPHTKALIDGGVASDRFTLDFVKISPISRAFAPMVRERRFDISEMAIATVLQAKAHGVAITLLPIAVAARFQESALLCRADSDIAGPADLAGRRVGVRAYSQTTGLWLRGVLAEDFGVKAEDVRWVTFEGAHVAQYVDPAFVERAAAGKDMLAMLREGELDAVIVGADVPDDPGLRAVFPDPVAAGRVFRDKHGFMPINHMIVVKSELAEAHAEELCRMFVKAAGAPQDRAPIGRAAVQPSLTMALRLAEAQGLLTRPLDLDEIWRGSPMNWL